MTRRNEVSPSQRTQRLSHNWCICSCFSHRSHMGTNADGVPVNDVEHLGAGGDPDGLVIHVRARGRILVGVRQGAGEHRKDQDEQYCESDCGHGVSFLLLLPAG